MLISKIGQWFFGVLTMAFGGMRLIFLIILLSFCSPAVADEITGKVVRVVDGDTIVLLTGDHHQEKIRLAGIDAPERKQPFGKKSKNHLATQVAGKRVSITYYKRDRWGRMIGKILLGGRDINLEQIKSGFAWHFKKYQREQSEADREDYNEAEIAARKSQLGLWKTPSPLPPWEFRKIKKGK